MEGESGAGEEWDSTKGRLARRAAMGRRRKARMGGYLATVRLCDELGREARKGKA